MNLLLCIHNKSEESRHLIGLAVKVSEGFGADLSVVVVGKKAGGFMESELSLAQQSLAEWDLYQPGIDLLSWAFKRIIEFDYIHVEPNVFQPGNFIEENNRIRMVLPHSSGSQVSLILRQGKLLNELKSETEHHRYELTMIKKPARKKLIHHFIQFLNSSVFIVPDFDLEKPNDILLCVNDARLTKRAVMYGAIISRQFGNNIKVVTVSKNANFRKGYRNASRWADKYLTRFKAAHNVEMKTGRAVELFVKDAGSEHIIVMGCADRNEIVKYLFGSKPIHTAQRAQCPVLVVK